MHLWIVRHGHCLADSPDSDLSSLGEQQALQTARRLVDEGITAIISSPLVRALGTASIIAEKLDAIPLEVWPELREGFSWQHRAYSRTELLRRYPRAILPLDFASDGWDYGNDTYESVLARCQQTANRLKERFLSDERVVMVTHGGFASYFLHTILQIPSATPQWFEIDYCGISRVYFVPERQREAWPLYPAVTVKVLTVNDCSHLITI